MTHTPGPWHKRNVTEIWGGPDKHIASTKNRSMDNGLISHEIDANARLIAAAPEMLEALKAARVVVEADGARATLSIIDAAIAKAEGKP